MLKSKARISLLLILIIINCLLLNNLSEKKTDEINNQDQISSYLSEEKNREKTEIKYDELIGILSIPTIKLKRGFYSIDSPLNDVNKNIQVIDDSMDKLLILAAHRGNSKVSFFQNLDKLSMGDEIDLDYKHETFKYRLYYKYYEDKDGNLSIKYDNTKQVLVLITCVKNLKDKQVVYIAYKI